MWETARRNACEGTAGMSYWRCPGDWRKNGDPNCHHIRDYCTSTPTRHNLSSCSSCKYIYQTVTLTLASLEYNAQKNSVHYGLPHYQHKILHWYNCYFITQTVCMYLFYCSYSLWFYCSVLFYSAIQLYCCKHANTSFSSSHISPKCKDVKKATFGLQPDVLNYREGPYK